MQFESMNWMNVEDYLKRDDRLILILGACEQHGYLSLTTDVQIPEKLAITASQQTGVPVAPPLNFGISPYFLTYPGTISLRASTFLDVVEDMVRCVHGQGFRRLLILNGHGGNVAVRARLVEVANQLPDLRFAWYAWWLEESVQAVARKHGLKTHHADWSEAFPFCQVCDLPGGEKAEVTAPMIANAQQTRQIYGDGAFGGLYKVDPAISQEVFQAALDDILNLLKF